MKKNIFSAILAQTGLYLSAMVFIGAALASCNKEKQTPSQNNYDNGEIILNTTKSEEEKIPLWFAMKDTPIVEGAVESASKPGVDDWVIKTYKLTSNTVKVKGGVTKLKCSGCDLTEIKASECKRLAVLYCQENQLETLKLNGCTELKELYCYNNKLFYEGLTLPKVSAGNLYFNSTEQNDRQKLSPDEIKELNKKNWKVFQKNGSENVLYEGKDYAINMTTDKAVGSAISLWFAQDDSPIVEGADETMSKTDEGWLKKQYRLTSKTLTIKGYVTALMCNECNLTILNVSENTKLWHLRCGNNNISSLDLTKNIKLEHIYCSDNKLGILKLDNNAQLKELECKNNGISTLDVSKNRELLTLDCSKNGIETLDISKNENLQRLYCSNNRIKILNTSKNGALETLYCDNNEIKDLEISQNRALKELHCNNRKEKRRFSTLKENHYWR